MKKNIAAFLLALILLSPGCVAFGNFHNHERPRVYGGTQIAAKEIINGNLWRFNPMNQILVTLDFPFTVAVETILFPFYLWRGY